MGTMELLSVNTNCIKVQFGVTSKMPSDTEIFSFFRKRAWAPETLSAMFRVPKEHAVYVKFQSEDNMKTALLKCPSTDSFSYENGETAPVTFATATGDFRYVRLFGLPIEIEDKHVVSVLAKYGKVHRTTRERYGPETGFPILNGVRGVHVEMSKAIPEQLFIQHFQVRTFYEGMPVKCYVCQSTSHVKANCPKRQKITATQEESGSGTVTYAQALTLATEVTTPEQSSSNGQSAKTAQEKDAVLPRDPVQNVQAFEELAFGVSGEIDPPPPSRRDDEDEYVVDLDDPEWFTAKKLKMDLIHQNQIIPRFYVCWIDK